MTARPSTTGSRRPARDDTDHLALLLASASAVWSRSWHRRLGPDLQAPDELMAEALQHAAEFRLVNRVRLLLNGTPIPMRPAPTRATADGARTGAVRNGNLRSPRLLAAAGAATDTVVPADRVRRRPAATGRRSTPPCGRPGAAPPGPRRAPRPGRGGRAEFGATTTSGDDRPRVQMSNPRNGTNALHEAAWPGRPRHRPPPPDLVRPDITDETHGSTPSGWAAPPPTAHRRRPRRARRARTSS